MKIILTYFFSIFFVLIVNAQDTRFDLHPMYRHGIKLEKLHAATSISDIIEGYPKNWLTNFISVDISFKQNNNVKYISSTEILSKQQLEAIKKATLGSELELHVLYHKKNPVTEFLDVNILDYSFMVIPEKEAFYIGGIKALREYLNVQTKTTFIFDKTKVKNPGIVNFRINEVGDIIDVLLESSTSDATIDALLLEAVKQQPKWTPALNIDGKPVKQGFKIVMSPLGDC